MKNIASVILFTLVAIPLPILMIYGLWFGQPIVTSNWEHNLIRSLLSIGSICAGIVISYSVLYLMPQLFKRH